MNDQIVPKEEPTPPPAARAAMVEAVIQEVVQENILHDWVDPRTGIVRTKATGAAILTCHARELATGRLMQNIPVPPGWDGKARIRVVVMAEVTQCPHCDGRTTRMEERWCGCENRHAWERFPAV